MPSVDSSDSQPRLPTTTDNNNLATNTTTSPSTTTTTTNDIPAPRDPPPLLTPSDIAFLTTHGFLPVTLPPHLAHLFTRLATTASSFFDQPHFVKAAQYPPAHGTELGFYTVAHEKQYLTIRRQDQSQHHPSPTSFSPPTLDALARTLWTHTAAYLHRILCDLSRALAIAPAAWTPLTAGGALAIPAHAHHVSPTLLRMFRYEPDRGVAAPHTDGGLLTLCVGAGRGLQVWKRREVAGVGGADEGEGEDVDEGTTHTPDTPGEWVDADGPTVLIGTTLRVLSARRLAAGVHRVVGNPAGRESVVFALRPALDCVLALDAFGGEGYVDMRAFWAAWKARTVNVNAVLEEREAQRERLRKGREVRGMG